MKLTCSNNPEHKEFLMTAMVPETWLLDEDGDCEYAWEAAGCAIDSDLTTARCRECDALVTLKEE